MLSRCLIIDSIFLRTANHTDSAKAIRAEMDDAARNGTELHTPVGALARQARGGGIEGSAKAARVDEHNRPANRPLEERAAEKVL
jgi:hypothetical protein